MLEKVEGIRTLFSPIFYEDDVKTTRSLLLHRVTSFNIAILLIWVILSNLVELSYITVVISAVLILHQLIVKRLNNLQKTTFASYFLVYGLILAFSFGLYINGGHFTDFYLAFIVIPMLSNMLLEKKQVFVTTSISILVGFVVLILEINYLVPTISERFNATTHFLSKTSFILIVAVYLFIIQNTRKIAKIRSEQIITNKAVEQYSMSKDSERVDQLSSVVMGISHDFNNFLTLIQNYQDIINESKNDESSEDYLEISKITQRAVDLNKLLMKYVRGQESDEITKISLNDAISDNMPIYEKLAGPQNKVIFQKGKNLKKITFRSIHLDQILSNLLVNARDATENHGTVYIRTFAADLDLSPWVCLELEDTGKGISDAAKKHIFQPFFSTKEIGKGRGVGLSNVKQILDGYGAKISFSSEVGKGTKFLIIFPIQNGD